MMWVLLYGCGGDVINHGNGGPRPGDTDAGDTDGGDTDTGEDTALPEVTAAELVARVRADGAQAMSDLAGEVGWPAATVDGLLVVRRGGGTWQVAGDFDGWAGQDMSCGDGLCWALIGATDGGYKFTDGSAWEADAWSRRYRYDEFGELSLVASADAHLERHFAVGDDTMEARNVRVLVPAGEATHVLYAQDGQNLFDPEAMWGGWRLQDTAPDGVMIVGIDNTVARMEEYTHVADTLDGVAYGGQGDAYVDFVQDTVRPLVATTYGEPAVVGVMGSSLGGLISVHAALRHPGEYRFAASLSGTMGWGSIEQHNPTMIERYAAAGHGTTALYLDSGGSYTDCADADGDGVHDDDLGSSDNYCENAQLRDVLAAGGYTYDVDLWHWWEAGAAHNEAAWADRVSRPLSIFVALH